MGRLKEFNWPQIARQVILLFPFIVGLGIFYFLGLIVSLTDQNISSAFLLLGFVFVPSLLTLIERVNCLETEWGLMGLIWDKQRVWIRYVAYMATWIGLMAMVIVFAQVLAWHLQWFVQRYAMITVPVTLISCLLILAVWWWKWIWEKGLVSLYLFGLLVIGIILVTISVQTFETEPVFAPFRFEVNIFNLVGLIMGGYWFVDWLVTRKRELSQPNRHWWLVLVISVFIMVGLLWLSGRLIEEYLVYVSVSYAPLLDLLQYLNPWQLPVWSVTYMVAVVVLLWAGLQMVVQRIESVLSFNQMEVMILPGHKTALGRWELDGLRWLSLLLIVTLNFMDIESATRLASAALLILLVVLHWPDVWSRRALLPKRRRFKLAYHPLFPSMVVLLGLVLLMNVVSEIWMILGAFVIVLASYYWLRARGRMVAAYQEQQVAREVIGSEESIERSNKRLVLLVLDNPRQLSVSLAYLRRFVTRLQSAEVLILYIGEPNSALMDEMKAMLVENSALPIVQLIQRRDRAGVQSLQASLDEETFDYLLLPSNLELTDKEWAKTRWLYNESVFVLPDLVPADDPGLLIISSPKDVTLTPPLLLRSLSSVTNSVPVLYFEDDAGSHRSLPRTNQITAIKRSHVKEALEQHVSRPSVVLVYADYSPIFGHYSFDETVLQSLRSLDTPALLYVKRDVFWQRWLRRLRHLIIFGLPQISRGDQMEIYRSFNQNGKPSIDFYVLILLSSLIATAGLIQNSAAVIIGAMLVAPLMTPILAMAAAIVQGSLRHLTIAAEATVKGVALAVGVSLGLSLLVAFGEPSSEILGRTQPQFLDLIVALVSGAAAAYAMSRKNLLAALPGVAIAAALVPPLCVVGYGLATGQLSIAMGSGLLFVTNLIAIVFAGAMMLLALGYRPIRRDYRDELMLGIRISFVSLLVIAGILTWMTVPTFEKAEILSKVNEILSQPMVSRVVHVDTMRLERTNQGYVLHMTVLSYDDKELTEAQVMRLFDQVQMASKKPITLRVTIVAATRAVIKDDRIEYLNPTPVPEGPADEAGNRPE